MSAIASIEITNLVMKSAGTLDERLADLISTSRENTPFLDEVELFPIHNLNGFSGYNFWVQGKLTAQLHLAALTSGYYVFLKKSFLNDEEIEIYDYYNTEGKLSYSSGTMDGSALQYSSINMDPTSPFANYFYNLITLEYNNAKEGNSNSQRIQYVENLLNKLLEDSSLKIAANNKVKDDAFVNIDKEMIRIENDPILKWSERRSIYKSLQQVKAKIIATKKRVHGYNALAYNMPLTYMGIKQKASIFKQRPLNNLTGVANRVTVGNLVWFWKMVKSNLGLSIAMAIYGPFTFYFITQPMNPHAMWTVGKVRSTYIDMVDFVSAAPKSETSIVTSTTHSDSVTTKSAAIQKQSIKDISQGISDSWDERMSNFKAMEIGYEENLVFAERVGRVEHMENQFLFPLTAQGSWYAMQSYIKEIEGLLGFNKNLDHRYVEFLEKEVVRTREIQIYVWKKMSQFFKDHPFMVMDQKNEQSAKDYYTGNAFIFMEEMTRTLSELNLASSNDSIHLKVADLARKYKSMRVEGESILDTLKKNTSVFAQSDVFSSDELRVKMRRHWEVLFLQQNKKQEAASFGLQTYTWSIKNTMWIIQSLYNAKREDLGSLTYKFNLDNKNTDTTKSNMATNKLYESMMNMMMIDFVGIRKEIANNLKNDNEAELRIEVINSLRSSISQRDKLFQVKRDMAINKSNSDNRI